MQNPKREYGVGKSLVQGRAGRSGSCPKHPNCPKSFSKALLKARWKGGVVGCCKFLGVRILCSYSCSSKRQMLLSLYNFSSLCTRKCVKPLEVRALRTGYPVYFRLKATFFFFFLRCMAQLPLFRVWTETIAVKAWNLNHQATRDSPLGRILKAKAKE